ncbi:LysE family translocator [Mesorhizobium sp. NBSH29]|uniref:LysE family translocator n=1 Tax=Mesorhizobium sp. NBSH29 TaxID=2654249 RepID=UPI0018969AEF|nr:LysE family translocator [Mesorhizobium sp. NBSH29]QPC86850.1 LysE family translocator [Mesorhizobium sp. NBSH29]
MPELSNIVAFALIALGMVLTPGPNMIYLVSRSICQGRVAGMISLGGVALGFVVYLVAAAFGITALLMAVPFAYDVLRLAGVVYLLWLAWQSIKPGGRSVFQVHVLKPDRPRRLFAMGLMTALLNPKIAVLYLSLLPHFIDTSRSLLPQLFILCGVQISISIIFNMIFIVIAGTLAAFLAGRPFWALVQRWLMATVLAGLALKMATEAQR